jgi:hypothetical protein
MLPEKKVSEYTAALRIVGTELKNSPIVSPVAAIGPDAKGNITLTANDAQIEGNGLAVEERGGVANLGYWDSAADYAEWKVNFVAPGSYQVVGSFAAAAGASVLTIEFAGRKIEAGIPPTNGWDDYREVDCGTLQIDKSGEAMLVARPRDPATWKAVNLRSLKLLPK